VRDSGDGEPWEALEPLTEAFCLLTTCANVECDELPALSNPTKPKSGSSMQGLGDLPVELLFIITDQISRKDLLNLRLCAPRNILPFFDVIVFREIYLPIDTSDDLERRRLDDEKEGVALQRLVDVSQSRIVKHVRILVLRVARLYSLITAFGIFLFAFPLLSLLVHA